MYGRQTSLLNSTFHKTNLHLSGAYNIELSQGKNNLVFGLDAGFIQSSFTADALTTGAQYTYGVGFSSSNENQLVITEDRTSAVDLSFGMHFNHKQNFSTRNDKFNISTGFVAYHLNQPSMSFSGDKTTLPLRLNVYAITFNKLSKKVFLQTEIHYHNQSEISMLQAGLFVYYLIRDKEESLLNTSVTTGAYYRVNDAVIPYAKLEYKSFGIGLSYDITISDLSSYAEYNGGWEIFAYGLLKVKPGKGKKKESGGARFKSDY